MLIIIIEDIKIEVEQKNIKNINLRIYPPDGKVKITAPKRLHIDTIAEFARSKLDWIRKKQEKFNNRPQKIKLNYVSNEVHYFLGKKYLLKVLVHNSPPRVILGEKEILMFIRTNTTLEKRKNIMDAWFRSQLKSLLPTLIKEWGEKIRVKADACRIRKMHTRWGSCNITKKRIWLNLELAKKPLECLEYVIVHELVHLLERKHNSVFRSHMDRFLPDWRNRKDLLNHFPNKHPDWEL